MKKILKIPTQRAQDAHHLISNFQGLENQAPKPGDQTTVMSGHNGLILSSGSGLRCLPLSVGTAGGLEWPWEGTGSHTLKKSADHTGTRRYCDSDSLPKNRGGRGKS